MTQPLRKEQLFNFFFPASSQKAQAEKKQQHTICKRESRKMLEELCMHLRERETERERESNNKKITRSNEAIHH